jgi:hypothetical protein
MTSIERNQVIDDKNVVGLTYCNKTEFVHEWETPIEAIEEFTKLLANQVEPEEADQPVHLRQVVLTIFSDKGQPVRRIDSGIFPCDHDPHAS